LPPLEEQFDHHPEQQNVYMLLILYGYLQKL